jgi:hypothetical protein
MDPSNGRHNILRGIQAGMHLIRAGYAPLVPHLTDFTRPYGHFPLATWLEVDLPWVAKADAVLRLPGPSRGADAEEAFARARGIPVFSEIRELFQQLPRTRS